ncbi:MAG: secondary thiamine-phosphate synthase enzyme YjbQ [Caldimicrobium sp.]|nr:secondary thiamine-phosphate synthase enzyme YjbQ [Caldimicrobium sp.]MCX7873452.1 secondary thiamine-phosphate synthase enzyme YjbQ [Caldimicrobium sp.]MDW8095037.1 secondary thiamine-phosphate synthase enzyme YjbQ [Caldimicrobium sp.]
MGKVFELEIDTQSKEQVIDITSEIEKIVQFRQINEGMMCLYVPHTSAAVTIHRKLEDPKKPRLPELLDKVNPEEEATPYTKAALVAPTEVLIIREGKIILGRNQRIYFYEFNGPQKRKILLYVSD